MSASKVILLTGGSSGIGYYASLELAKQPDTLVVVASRSAPPGQLPSNVVHQKLDLSDTQSVRSLVNNWSHGTISSLVLNAGVSPFGAPTFDSNGIETTLAVNHLHHALLVFLIKDRGLLAKGSSIVILTSAMHDPKAPLAPACPHWTSVKDVAASKQKELKSALVRYANSKLANLLFTYSLERRAEAAGLGWRVFAFEPGFTPGSGLHREAPWAARIIGTYVLPNLLFIFRWFGTVTSTPPNSGKQLAHYATSQDNELNGRYVLLNKIKPSSPESYDKAKQEELWEWTLDQLAASPEERAQFDKF
ncbi:NAD(P)-binding protein [Meredithblackwellia eburnea MCA 4105]